MSESAGGSENRKGIGGIVWIRLTSVDVYSLTVSDGGGANGTRMDYARCKRDLPVTGDSVVVQGITVQIE